MKNTHKYNIQRILIDHQKKKSCSNSPNENITDAIDIELIAKTVRG